MGRDRRLEEFKKELVLDLLHEEDCGLWEPFWELRRSMPDAEAQALAEQAVRELFADGLVSLYRWTWGMNERPTIPDALDRAEVEAEIAASWWREIPLKSADVWITATPRAEADIGKSS